MTGREVLKLALEALENTTPTGFNMERDKQFFAAISAIKEALAQPDGCQCPACKVTPHASDCAVHNEPAYPKGACDCGGQPEQEPVAITITGKLGNIYSFTGDYSLKKGDKVYTTPPQRKPLTIVELQKHWQVAKVLDMTDAEISFPDYVLITKDVEALHGIKENNS